jgi:hypothetical protein
MFNNEFVCPDGHSFNANAKIRARCPECGKSARRTYATKEPTPITTDAGVDTGSASVPPSAPVSTSPEPEPTGITLIRKGKPRGIMATKKPAATPAAKTKKTVTKTKSVSGLVTTKTAAAGTKKKPVMPRVVKRPPRTAIARHIAGGRKSYADEMIEQYGIRR